MTKETDYITTISDVVTNGSLCQTVGGWYFPDDPLDEGVFDRNDSVLGPRDGTVCQKRYRYV
jgi:hypothetical protein